ncbi:MAG: hypothetical protein QOJ40_1073 [Verrucomicrobiota bacterium]
MFGQKIQIEIQNSKPAHETIALGRKTKPGKILAQNRFLSVFQSFSSLGETAIFSEIRKALFRQFYAF